MNKHEKRKAGLALAKRIEPVTLELATKLTDTLVNFVVEDERLKSGLEAECAVGGSLIALIGVLHESGKLCGHEVVGHMQQMIDKIDANKANKAHEAATEASAEGIIRH